MAAYIAASLVWLAVTVVGRARWFDLRCLRHDWSSVSMEWVGWFPPHFACLDPHGQVVARDYTETLWLLAVWGPIVVAGLMLLVLWRRARTAARP